MIVKSCCIMCAIKRSNPMTIVVKEKLVYKNDVKPPTSENQRSKLEYLIFLKCF